MQFLPLDAIAVGPQRQRREFEADALMELQVSIEDYGLFHPIVVREPRNGEEGSCILVAGERRLRVLRDMAELGSSFRFNGQEVQLGFAPVVTLGELSPLAAEEAELSENIHRKDLTWQENAEALQRLHNLRVAQAAAVGVEHAVSDTAQEVLGRRDGSYQDKVRKTLIVARYLDNPDVAKAKSVDDAFKLIKREEQHVRNEELAKQVGERYSAASHTAVLSDCLPWLRSCEREVYDVICTDPPYGIGADDFGDGAGQLVARGHAYADDASAFEAWVPGVVRELTRVGKPQCHCYWFCDIDWFDFLRAEFRKNDWEVHRTPLIFHKLGNGRVPWPAYGPRRQWEMILYAVRGKKPVNVIKEDVLSYKSDENLGHAAQKPVGLIQDLLARSCKPGDKVLDCFMGSGVIFPAAHSLKLYATGIEVDPASYGMALQRLKDIG